MYALKHVPMAKAKLQPTYARLWMEGLRDMAAHTVTSGTIEEQ
jgi:hypothetical protein